MPYLKLKLIKTDPDQPRQVFDPVTMESLEKSIKEKGILTPLIVEQVSKDNYLVIDGERRYRVASKLNIEEIPVEIMNKMTPQERMVTRFHLQEQHQSWTSFDKARAIYFFMKDENLPVTEVADLLGMSTGTVSNWIGILDLSKKTQIKSLERRIPFTYLSKIAKVAREYEEIIDLSLPEIESILLDKIETKAIYKHIELSNLLRFLLKEGNKDKKIKFLKDPNYTVKNMLEQTPEGRSIKIDLVVYRASTLKRLIQGLKKIGCDKILSKKQKLSFEELQQEIERFIS